MHIGRTIPVITIYSICHHTNNSCNIRIVCYVGYLWHKKDKPYKFSVFTAAICSLLTSKQIPIKTINIQIIINSGFQLKDLVVAGYHTYSLCGYSHPFTSQNAANAKFDYQYRLFKHSTILILANMFVFMSLKSKSIYNTCIHLYG